MRANCTLVPNACRSSDSTPAQFCKVNRQKKGMSSGFFPKSDVRKITCWSEHQIFLFPIFVPGPEGISCYFYSCWGFPISRYMSSLFHLIFANASSALGCSRSWRRVLHSSYLHPKLPLFHKQQWSVQYKTEMASQYNFVHPRRKHRLWTLNVSRWTTGSNSGPSNCSPAVFHDRRKDRMGRREG